MVHSRMNTITQPRPKIIDYGLSKITALIVKYPESEYLKRLHSNFHIFVELYLACKPIFDKKAKGGSYLICGYTWPSYEYVDYNYLKQQMLYDKVKNLSNVLEIGVFMCHSILIMLLANPRLKITAVDIDPTYCKLCMPVIRKYFPLAEINLIYCDSLTFLNIIRTVRTDTIWDMIHVDGQHVISHVKTEYSMLRDLTKSIIFDDIAYNINVFLGFAKDGISHQISNPDIRYANMYLKLKE
jgi:hypothetical protein